MKKAGLLLSILLLSTFGIAQVAPDSSVVVDSTLKTNEFSAVETEIAEEVTSQAELSSEVFKNVAVKEKAEGAIITWSLDYDLVDQLKGQQLVIRYQTNIGVDRMEAEMEGYDWMYTDPFPASDVKYQFKDLEGNEKYVFYLGLAKDGDIEASKGNEAKMVWSDKIKVKTLRSWGIMKMLILIGSLGLFIFGMKIMSDGMQRAAGQRLRTMLGSMTSNRVKGVLTGFASTTIVQSSSVTTVMTVSLVNAGLLNLRQSAGVMMGANVGTTITAWLVLLLGFKVSISSYALVMIAFGAPLLFFSFRRSKDIANTIIGFAILFIGLQFLKDSVPDLDKDSALVQFFLDYKDHALGNVMFVALGALVTIVIQSSSAAMALTLTMVSKGIIPFEVACAMVLGENIGTTITAELASMIGNVHAKRSARIHSLFNVVGVTWMLLIMPLFLTLVGSLVSMTLDGAPWDPKNPEMANSGIALFHTLFNLANIFILIWFVPQLVRIAERTVKSRGDDEEFKLDYISAGGVEAPEVAILEAKKEVAKFGKITSKMPGFVRTILNVPDKKAKNKMYKKLEKYEEITDRVEVEIATYLEKIATNQMSQETSTRVRSMLSITNDLERIGDIFYQMSKALEKKEEEQLYFLPDQREKLNRMLDLLEKSFKVMNENLSAEYGSSNLEKAIAIEEEINQLRDDLRKDYLENIQKGEYNINAGMIYNNLFSSCEKVGDHTVNVSEAVNGQL